MSDYFERNTETPLRPCPIDSGRMIVVTEATEGPNTLSGHLSCVECQADYYLSSDEFNSAYCWKEIDSLRQRLKEAEETLKKISGGGMDENGTVIALEFLSKAKQRTEGEGT